MRLLCLFGQHRWVDREVTPFKAGDFLLIRDGEVLSEWRPTKEA